MRLMWDLKCRLTKLLMAALIVTISLLIYVSLNVFQYGASGRKSLGHDPYKFEQEKVKLATELERRNVMSELGLLDEIDSLEMKSFQPKIVYNRVGKCGSRSMLTLLGKLAKVNKFTLFQSPVSNHSQVPIKDRIRIARVVQNMPPPCIYSRHVHFIDFPKYGVSLPTYINLIRDPIERFSSHYHFLRYGDNNKAQLRSYGMNEKERNMDINDCILSNHRLCTAQKLFYIIPYFCGQDVMCQSPSQDSLYRAKIHVLEKYLVVGYLEDFDGMLQVLEALLPRYFDGINEFWKHMAAQAVENTSTIKKRYINETARAVLKERLKEEYEFYNFVRFRFKLMKKQISLSDY